MALCEQAQGASAQYSDPFIVDGRAPRSHEVVSQLADIDAPRPSEARKGPMVVEDECIEVPRSQTERAL
jgi:hypothetical protein